MTNSVYQLAGQSILDHARNLGFNAYMDENEPSQKVVEFKCEGNSVLFAVYPNTIDETIQIVGRTFVNGEWHITYQNLRPAEPEKSVVRTAKVIVNWIVQFAKGV